MAELTLTAEKLNDLKAKVKAEMTRRSATEHSASLSSYGDARSHSFDCAHSGWTCTGYCHRKLETLSLAQIQHRIPKGFLRHQDPQCGALCREMGLHCAKSRRKGTRRNATRMAPCHRIQSYDRRGNAASVNQRARAAAPPRNDFPLRSPPRRTALAGRGGARPLPVTPVGGG